MHEVPPLLFNELSVFNVLENQKAALKNAAREMTREALAAPDQQIIDGLVERFCLAVPTLHENEIYATEKEIQADVSGDPYRMIFDRSRPFYVAATEITIHVPFDGESVLFRVQPSSYSLSPPRAFVSEGELRIVYQVTNPQFNIESDYKQRLAQIKQYLGSLRESSGLLLNDLRALAASQLAERRRQLQASASVVGSLGVPVRRTSPAGEQPLLPGNPRSEGTPKHTRWSPPRRWDVFISHASEDKLEIATPLAKALEARGLEVWYDDFSLKLGDSLRQAIDHGLAQSRYGVVILSDHFFAKHWPQQELNGLATREIGGDKVILPIWHNIGFERVREFSPTLADRMAAKSSDGLDVVVGKIADAIGPKR